MSDSTRQPQAGTPHIDTQSLTDKDTDVFETVATLEFAGQRPSRSAITAATRLDPAEVDQILADLTAQGLLTAADEPGGARGPGETVYEPARRDWSTQPDRAAGHPFS